MPQVISHLISQFKEFYKGLTPIKRASIIGSGVIIVFAVGIVSFMLSGADYAPLFKDVPEDQVALVVDKLRNKNIPFRLKNDGQTVMIPKELVRSTQMSLMTELGQTNIGNVGLELFEDQNFGVTSYAQRVNYQRALQGELMRAINSLSSVKKSKVLLALPADKTFLEKKEKPSASIVLKMYPGKSVDDNQVEGITHLVSNSVENMKPKHVTVVNDQGEVLSSDNNSRTAGTSQLLDLQQEVEQRLERRIQTILSKVTGTGKVIARVNAELDPQKVSMVKKQVNPDGTALRSSQTEEEVLDGARRNPAGAPGSRSNLPGNEGEEEIGFQQNVQKEMETKNFAVPRTVKNIKQAAGNLKRVSVAVLVDGTTQTVTGEGGQTTKEWKPLSDEKMNKIETVVKNAIGFNASRGDKVSVQNLRFKDEEFKKADRLLTNLERRKLLYALFKWSLLGIALALFFFIVVRPFMRWITDSFQDTVEDMLPRTIEELEELQTSDNSLPGMSAAMPALEESLDPDKAESELLRERIMSLIEKDEEKAAGAFDLWLSRRDL